MPVGERVVIETEVVSVGKRLATVRGVMRREGGGDDDDDGVVLASCLHDKVCPAGEKL